MRDDPTQPSRLGWFPIVFTVALLVLISTAIGATNRTFPYFEIAVAVALVAVVHGLYPRSGFFTLVLANFVGAYACLFTIFIVNNFVDVSRAAAQTAFVLPLVAFIAGVYWRRDVIRRIVHSEEMSEEPIKLRPFLWLLPTAIVGLATSVVPLENMSPAENDYVLLGAMGVISAVVLFASRDITIFLIETGFLFQDFFLRVAALAKPAVAFLTFYSMIIIVFACLYRIVDVYDQGRHFLIDGEAREIDFVESLYFSIVTLSTLGYGDIVPLTHTVRLLAACQILAGVMLLLFGMQVLMSYARR